MLSIVVPIALSLSLGTFSFSQQTLTSKVDHMILDSVERSKALLSPRDKQQSFQSSYKKIESLVNSSVLKIEIAEDDLAKAGVHQIVALSLTELVPNKADQGFTPSSCASAQSTLSKAHSDATKKEPSLIELRERVQKFIQSECRSN